MLVKIQVQGQEGYGSGAILSADGVILTCAHVAEPGSELVVVTSDGREFEAEKLGMNRTNDYALIRIQARGLSAFDLADSDQVRVRDWVVALGHPGGPYGDLKPAVAVGRVRGLHQKVPVQLGQKYYDDAIQTDCPIFGGNSGGPLVNLRGELLGINGAINPASDSSYTIPIGEVERDLAALQAGRDVAGRGGPGGFGNLADMLGQQGRRAASLDAALLHDRAGISIRSIEDGGTAQMSGLLQGDVITHAAGIAVAETTDLDRVVGWFRSGESTLFEVLRDGVRTPVVVTFGFEGIARDPILRRALFHLGLEAARSTVRVSADGEKVGYGVVIDEDGWILTAASLVAGASNVSVTLYAGHELEARVAGREGRLDVALLRIEPGDRELVAVRPGDLGALAPGDWVVSGGDYRGPLAVGAVSAVDREVGVDRRVPSLGLFDFFGGDGTTPQRPYPEVIQHDSNLDAAHVGSPLLDVDGRLVGINVGTVHRGTSYALPFDRIEAVLDRLREGLVVEGPKTYTPQADGLSDLFRQFFGKGEAPQQPQVDPDAPFLGIEADRTAVEEGVVVSRVVPDTGADRAGIEMGDVIVGFDGSETPTFEDLVGAIRRHEAGDEVGVTILREGERRTVRLTLGKRGGNR